VILRQQRDGCNHTRNYHKQVNRTNKRRLYDFAESLQLDAICPLAKARMFIEISVARPNRTRCVFKASFSFSTMGSLCIWSYKKLWSLVRHRSSFAIINGQEYVTPVVNFKLYRHRLDGCFCCLSLPLFSFLASFVRSFLGTREMDAGL